VLTVTVGGMVKKSLISELPGPSAQTFKLANVNDGDSLGWVVLSDGGKEILLATAQGMAIRFSEAEVRPMGLAAAGVNAITLGIGDAVVGVQVLLEEGEIFLVASDGKAKRVEQNDFPAQGRYGKGVIGWELPARVTLAGLAAGRKNDIITLHLAKAAPKMTRLDAAPLRKRSAVRGEAVVEVKADDAVLGITESWALERFVQKKEQKKVVKKK
jgi:DNA gyrase/topoisomerase IV subunit A